ncbi:MAG: hypothetical protein ACUVQG_05480 [Thermogutta sp.]
MCADHRWLTPGVRGSISTVGRWYVAATRGAPGRANAAPPRFSPSTAADGRYIQRPLSGLDAVLPTRADGRSGRIIIIPTFPASPGAAAGIEANRYGQVVDFTPYERPTPQTWPGWK